MKVSEKPITIDHLQIMEILPHRYPFLLLDRVIEFVDGEKVVGIKNVTSSEPFFQGHFPGRPVMPGVLLIETMAQTGAILAKKSSECVGPGKSVFLVGVDEFKFRRQVVPGDTLRVEMISVKRRRPLWIMRGTIHVGDSLVASGIISAAEAD